MLKGRRTRLCLNNTKLRQYREGFNSGMETKNSPISPSCAYQVSVHGIIYHRLVRNFIKRYFKESLLSIIGFLKHLGDVWPNIGRKWNQLEWAPVGKFRLVLEWLMQVSRAVWPDGGILSGPILHKCCTKSKHCCCFFKKIHFSNIAKIRQKGLVS